jgi:hypothetical protein
MYGDEDGDGDDKEIPKAYWHDARRVDQWIERMKQKRKDRLQGDYVGS